jgi:XTP/dITP diphosphohydrolase
MNLTKKGKLVFATGNQNKLREVRHLLTDVYDVVGLEDLGETEELPETNNTLEANALQKASYIKAKYGLDCFAEDTGLEIECLGGEPGVFSARYAGEQRDSAKNNELVLHKMANQSNRTARFRTVVALIKDGKTHLFEGNVNGTIRSESSGEEGFGYDPIFQPDGYGVTFAEMSVSQKNVISHRGKAIQKLVEFLKSLNN